MITELKMRLSGQTTILSPIGFNIKSTSAISTP
jgi:hypothetical protein